MLKILFYLAVIFSTCIGVYSIDPIEIKLNFGLHDDYSSNGETNVQIKNSSNKTVFQHKGKQDGWGGNELLDTLTEIGNYTVTVTYFVDSSKTKTITEKFSLSGQETSIGLTVVLSNGGRSEAFNTITIYKYNKNSFNLELKRLWDPQQQFDNDPSLLSKYELINKSDSTVYGVFHRFSSSISVSWIQLHYIAFTSIQEYENGKWISISCNSPRIQMSLKPGETGKTLEDMKLDCKKENFKKGGKYRILLEYGVNNTVSRKTAATDQYPAFAFTELNVYQIFDEFEIK